MTRSSGASKPILFIVISAIAVALAATLDRTVAEQVRAAGTDAFLRSHRILREILKSPGFYPFTILLAVVVAVAYRGKLAPTAFFLIATATALINEPFKWMVGRTRPFKTTTGTTDMLTPFQLSPLPGWSSENLSFPSGHTTLAFATAAALSILWPRWRWAFYTVALIVAAERVLENAHWLSDTVAGAALGIGCVWMVRKLLWDKFNWGNDQDERNTVLVAGDTRV